MEEQTQKQIENSFVHGVLFNANDFSLTKIVRTIRTIKITEETTVGDRNLKKTYKVKVEKQEEV